MKFRNMTAADETAYLQLADAFYHSEAVLHPVPQIHMKRTFDAVISGSPFVSCWMMEWEGKIAGFALLAHTWSQESGGEVVWVEELYVLPEYRGKGLGNAFFAFLRDAYPCASRFRLEIEPDNERAERLYKKMGFDFLEYRQMVLDTHCN